MPILAIGLPVTKDSLNRVLGTVCQQLEVNFDVIENLKGWSDNTQQADIEALGFTADEAYLIKVLIDDLHQLRTLYGGVATLANVKDFRTQARKAWGL